MKQEVTMTRTLLKAPRSAAIAGIIFSVLLITAVVLIRISVPHKPEDTGAWLSSSWNVALALYILPFSGIAFLWFMGVLRDRMSAYEDRFIATVFFGSGLLFLAMLFASAGVAGAIMITYKIMPGRVMESGTYTFGRTMAYIMINVYAVKMSGVWMISTCTLAIRTGIFPRWMAFLGYALALALLFGVGYFSWTLLVLPLWVLLVSCYMLFGNLS